MKIIRAGGIPWPGFIEECVFRAKFATEMDSACKFSSLGTAGDSIYFLQKILYEFYRFEIVKLTVPPNRIYLEFVVDGFANGSLDMNMDLWRQTSIRHRRVTFSDPIIFNNLGFLSGKENLRNQHSWSGLQWISTDIAALFLGSSLVVILMLHCIKAALGTCPIRSPVKIFQQIFTPFAGKPSKCAPTSYAELLLLAGWLFAIVTLIHCYSSTAIKQMHPLQPGSKITELQSLAHQLRRREKTLVSFQNHDVPLVESAKKAKHGIFKLINEVLKTNPVHRVKLNDPNHMVKALVENPKLIFESSTYMQNYYQGLTSSGCQLVVMETNRGQPAWEGHIFRKGFKFDWRMRLAFIMVQNMLTESVERKNAACKDGKVLVTGMQLGYYRNIWLVTMGLMCFAGCVLALEILCKVLKTRNRVGSLY